MTALSADRFPGAEHEPLAYPGVRPDFSYVYYQGKIFEITPRGDTYADLWVDENSAGKLKLDAFLAARGNATMEHRHAVLAVGSNGCPGRLAEKYANQPDVAVPVFVGTLADTAVVYTARLVHYGALPATYLHQPGAVSWLSVTMLTVEQLERMDKTEGIGQIYSRISVPEDFCIDDGPVVKGLTAYVDRKILTYLGRPVRLKMFAREGSDWPIMDEREILSVILDHAGLLPGESIRARHHKLLNDKTLRRRFDEFVTKTMSGLTLDNQGKLTNP